MGALQRWAIIAMATIILGGGFGAWERHQGTKEGEQAGITSCSKKIAKLDSRGTDACSLAIGAMQTKYAEAQAKDEADARAKEEASVAAGAAIDARHAQELQHAKQDADAVIADLRDGNLRLRQQWRGCEAAASVPASGASTGKPDAATEQRSQSAGDLVRIATEADAQIRALQALIRADRQ